MSVSLGQLDTSPPPSPPSPLSPLPSPPTLTLTRSCVRQLRPHRRLCPRHPALRAGDKQLTRTAPTHAPGATHFNSTRACVFERTIGHPTGPPDRLRGDHVRAHPQAPTRARQTGGRSPSPWGVSAPSVARNNGWSAYSFQLRPQIAPPFLVHASSPHLSHSPCVPVQGGSAVSNCCSFWTHGIEQWGHEG